MAFKLSKFDVCMIAAFVVATGAGIGGYFYTSGLVGESKTELGNAGSELQKLVKSRYFPSDDNIKALTADVDQLNSVLSPIQDKTLKPDSEKLLAIAPKNPVIWKSQDLDETVKQLTVLAQNKKVHLPNDYYFSFSRYQRNNPSEQATVVLGKQLYGIQQLATTLFEISGGNAISSLKGIRRAGEDESPAAPAAGGSAPASDSGPETIRVPIQTGGNGLYRLYPFEVEFTGSPYGLRSFLNKLQQVPVLFIVRYVQVSNTRPDSPKYSDLSKAVVGGDSRSGSGAAGRDFIFGAEQIQVRLRVDMVEWLGEKEKEGNKPAAKPAK
jgi:hypothetical protein